MNITSVTYIKDDDDNIDMLDVVIDEKHYGVPPSTANRYYVAVQEWLAAGNTVEAAKEYVLTWDDIRVTRDEILRDTDWTMTSGATVDQAQWAAYRQTIRDLPQTYKDKTPDDVVWPTQPSTAGPNT